MARRKKWKGQKKKDGLTKLEREIARLHKVRFTDDKFESARKSLLRAYICQDSLTNAQKRYIHKLASDKAFRFFTDDKKSHYVYAISAGDRLKIGHAKNPKKRLSSMQTANPDELKLEATIDCKTLSGAKKMERQMHRAMKKYHIRGEWFHKSALKIFDRLDTRFY